ncbi:MAG: flagellar biosynthesis protein FlhF [Thermoguttaceae bacterium]
MEIRTYRAGSMHEALALVRRDLGPDAAVLHTREVQMNRLFGLIPGRREIEVTASEGVHVPSRLPQPGPDARRAPARLPADRPPLPSPYAESQAAACPPRPVAPRPADSPSLAVEDQLSDLRAMLQELCRQNRNSAGPRDLPDCLFRLFTDLIEVDLNEEIARELVERLRREVPGAELDDSVLAKTRMVRMVEAELPVAGPIAVTPGARRLVALVGPTGVGKTTTIAKLAAHFRLREKRNVGLITVDTYRIAAVEQLRTYADIIDLPMEVVSSPREMREAARRMESLDLILMDTAGRSPRDEIKIQELRSFLSEAEADEVLLVLSTVAGERTLTHTAERFAAVGTTGMILTKLDEATSLGNLLPLTRSSRLPIRYVTNGQSVPDDIEAAEPGRLARLVLGMASVFRG